jgi:hypothetical protein
MSGAMPVDLPERQREKAKMDAFEWVVQRLYKDHLRMANMQGFEICLCPICRMVMPFMAREQEAMS